MGWTWTMMLLAAGIGLTIFHLIQANKRGSYLDVPLVPPTMVLLIGIMLIMIAGSHALTLMGLEHARSPFRF
jgi:hypothetical protein